MQIRLKILSPEAQIKDEMVDYVRFETDSGSFGVMKSHVPVAAHLRKSTIMYLKGSSKETYDIEGGFVRVLPDEVTVFID